MKERIITGAILLAVVIPLIVIGGWPFLILGVLATGMASIEMMNMFFSNSRNPYNQILLATVVAMTGWIVFGPLPLLLFSFLVGIIAAFAVVVVCKLSMKAFRFSIFTMAYVGLSFHSLLEIRNYSLYLFILLILTVILADSGAYFVGKSLGKHKLAPKVSPNKTIEGAVGGWVIAAAFAFGFGLWSGLFTNLWMLALLAIFVPILSMFGDLLASALKRKYGIKDYGNIFPGHGGVMDRVDSQLLAAILIYVIILIGGVI